MKTIDYLNEQIGLISGKIYLAEDFSNEIRKISHKLLQSEEGIQIIRDRKGPSIKRFIEELIPLEAYVRNSNNPFYNLKVKWINGSQQYDAIVYTEKSNFSEKLESEKYIEITVAQIPNLHLTREHLEEHGFCWSAKSTKKNKKVITSTPYSYTNDEHIDDLLKIIDDRIIDKKSKKYPKDTVLLITIETDMLIYNSEWKKLINKRLSSVSSTPFKEIYLIISESNFIISI